MSRYGRALHRARRKAAMRRAIPDLLWALTVLADASPRMSADLLKMADGLQGLRYPLRGLPVLEEPRKVYTYTEPV